MENLLNLIFPEKCIGCGSLSEPICRNCFGKLKILKEQYCIFCGKRSVNGKTHYGCRDFGAPLSLYSCYEYSGFVRDCVHYSKYISNQFSILRRLFDVVWEWDLFAEFIDPKFLVVPIPLHAKKLQQRGFNQSEIIANTLCRKFGLEKNTNVLKRVKRTEKQHEKDRAERFLNLECAFKADPRRCEGKNVLLIDDVCTTGATFISASKSLYQMGAREVRCFALCRTPLML